MASYKKLADGKYKLIAELGYSKETGKKIRKTKTIHTTTDKKAEKAAILFEEEARKNYTKDFINTTFKTFYEGKFKELYLCNLKQSTQNNYKRIENEILEYFGNIPIKKIKPIHIEDFFKQQEKKGLKSASLKFQCLKSVFSRAYEWELIDNNPIKRVKPKKSEKREREIYNYTREQVLELFRLLENPKYRKLSVEVKLACLCGMRAAEIAALTTKDVDIKNKTITIKHALQRNEETGERFVSTTKPVL